jgi:hypothetical protein
MQVTKDNKVIVYKSNAGKLDVFININGEQYKSTVFPNVEDDMTVRSWGGNVYANVEESNNG